jgi:hydroxyacylglutathione hydrolase
VADRDRSGESLRADGSVRVIPLRVSNAYLVKGDGGFVLIDTGFRFDRTRLERELEAAGCRPGDLRLILVTHADADHSGNAAYLRGAYGAEIATHRLEVPGVERGDMFLCRGSLRFRIRMAKPLMGLFRLRKADRFTPDVYLDDGDRLDAYGLDATVLHVPGHTVGSIAVLTGDGAFFSGDFLEDRRRPSIATFVDDADALRRSYDRAKQLGIRVVYPGHGRPFAFEEIGGVAEGSES